MCPAFRSGETGSCPRAARHLAGNTGFTRTAPCATPLSQSSVSQNCLPPALWQIRRAVRQTQAYQQDESREQVKKSGLDATDIRILRAVQEHGQLSKARLSEIVNISATPCWARLDRLKAQGFIRGFHADIALNRICDFSQVMVTVSLTHHRRIDFDRFESWVARRDEITECAATGGGMDYVMKTICPSLAAFQALMQDMLEAELGVDRYMTYITTRVVKSAQPNLAKLAGPVPSDRTV